MYPAVGRVLIRFSRAAVLDQVYLCFVLELLLDGLEPLPETLELLLAGLCIQQ